MVLFPLQESQQEASSEGGDYNPPYYAPTKEGTGKPIIPTMTASASGRGHSLPLPASARGSRCCKFH